MKQILIAMILALICLPVLADDNGATVIDEFGCVIIPADSGLPVALFSDDSHFVENHAGNVNMWCDFVFDTALCPDDKAMRARGFTCGTLAGLATKTHAVTDCEYGVVHLSCQVKAN